MENKKVPGKYFLVFEPKYSYHQCAIYFGEGETRITKIKKYTDECYDNSKKKIKKNTLAEIDSVLASYSDLDSFFKEQVSSDAFQYQGYNLYKMFIGTKKNERIHTLSYVVNNPELLEKIKYVEGNKIYDYDGIRDMIELIITSDKNSFVRFLLKSKKEQTTNLSSSTIELAASLRAAKVCFDNSSDVGILKLDLEEKLTSYKEYREMFLLSQRYKEELRMQKEELEQIRLKAIETSEKEQLENQKRTAFRFDESFPEYEQLTLDNSIGTVKTIGTKK